MSSPEEEPRVSPEAERSDVVAPAAGLRSLWRSSGPRQAEGLLGQVPNRAQPTRPMGRSGLGMMRSELSWQLP